MRHILPHYGKSVKALHTKPKYHLCQWKALNNMKSTEAHCIVLINGRRKKNTFQALC